MALDNFKCSKCGDTDKKNWHQGNICKKCKAKYNAEYMKKRKKLKTYELKKCFFGCDAYAKPGGKYCSDECSTIGALNNLAENRAKRLGRVTKECSVKGCRLIFVVIPDLERTKCPKCIKREDLNIISNPNNRYNENGKTYRDSRHYICNNNGNGPLCADYNDCLESAWSAKGRKMPCDINKKNCHRVVERTTRASYGSGLSGHLI